MTDFIQGENRNQATLFPERLDDYIAEESDVRFIDYFVDGLNKSGLGFRTEPSVLGRPAYDPSMMLKLYIYGYMNRIQSSRRLERECQRNVELMWLTGKLAPDFKTIADFRKDNGKAIRLVCREFVMLCRKLKLFTDAFVAIDGSKFKAVNSKDNNLTKAKLKARLRQIDQSIERYLDQLESADRYPDEFTESKHERLGEKIDKLKEEMARLKQLEVRMLEHPDQQLSMTDPDSRSMATSGKGTALVGYNVQLAVDTKHHLIVEHEVSNVGNDRKHLHRMARRTKATLDVDSLTVVADRGYWNGDEVKACDEDNIVTYLPKTQTSGAKAEGRFGKQDFRYIEQDDEYLCPARERAIYRFSRIESGKVIRRYWSSACIGCPIKEQCTPSDYRRISRWEHEAVTEAAERRLEQKPEMMRLRRQTVEHPFGTLKAWMGRTPFLTKTLPKVSTEMSLSVLAYNIRRLITMFGVAGLIEAIQTA
jgi:transposase